MSVLKPIVGSNPPGAPFAKRLRWFIQTAPEGSVRMVITPAMAEEMLKYNTGNRPASPGTVKDYARQMKAGQWMYNGQPIIFADDGQLNDGQHRLFACVESGAAFTTDVVFGVPRAAFVVTDRGKKRTTGDIFAINGVPNYSSTAAACLWLWRYENTGMDVPAKWVTPTAEEMYQFYLDRADILKSYPAGRRFHEAKLTSPSIMQAMHYVCAQKNRARADDIFKRLATGIGLASTSDPVFKLRKRLVSSAIGGSRLDPVYAAAFTIMTWNAVRKNGAAPLLRWRGEQQAGQPFPRAV